MSPEQPHKIFCGVCLPARLVADMLHPHDDAETVDVLVVLSEVGSLMFMPRESTRSYPNDDDDDSVTHSKKWFPSLLQRFRERNSLTGCALVVNWHYLMVDDTASMQSLAACAQYDLSSLPPIREAFEPALDPSFVFDLIVFDMCPADFSHVMAPRNVVRFCDTMLACLSRTRGMLYLPLLSVADWDLAKTRLVASDYQHNPIILRKPLGRVRSTNDPSSIPEHSTNVEQDPTTSEQDAQEHGDDGDNGDAQEHDDDGDNGDAQEHDDDGDNGDAQEHGDDGDNGDAQEHDDDEHAEVHVQVHVQEHGHGDGDASEHEHDDGDGDDGSESSDTESSDTDVETYATLATPARSTSLLLPDAPVRPNRPVLLRSDRIWPELLRPDTIWPELLPEQRPPSVSNPTDAADESGSDDSGAPTVLLDDSISDTDSGSDTDGDGDTDDEEGEEMREGVTFMPWDLCGFQLPRAVTLSFRELWREWSVCLEAIMTGKIDVCPSYGIVDLHNVPDYFVTRVQTLMSSYPLECSSDVCYEAVRCLYRRRLNMVHNPFPPSPRRAKPKRTVTLDRPRVSSRLQPF